MWRSRPIFISGTFADMQAEQIICAPSRRPSWWAELKQYFVWFDGQISQLSRMNCPFAARPMGAACPLER
jgi:hypothetical protein